jgi:methylglutamate dehydrogenase subunit B
MRINCPHCGLRDIAEFTYAGDALRTRPEQSSTDQDAWHDYVFNRANPRGRHKEFWQHNHGCRAHLIVERDVTTHEIFSTESAKKPPVTLEAEAPLKAKIKKAAKL